MKKKFTSLILTLAAVLFSVSSAASANAEGGAPADDGHKDDAPAPFTEGIQAWSNHNYDQAYTVFRENAEKGSPQAMTALGYMYTTGSGVPADYSTGLHWYRLSAAAGEPYAMYALYEFLRGHPVLEVKPGEGREMLVAAVDKKLSLACREYYALLQEEKKTDEAQTFLKKSADEEQIWAMTTLGALLCEQNNAARDEKTGLELLTKSADKGDPVASYAAATVERRNGNTSEADKHLADAAAQNYGPALYEQGRLALEEKRGQAAVELLDKAAANGCTAAWLLLGSAYEHGQGVAYDLASAARYYRQAVDAGDAAGYNELGRLTEKGAGVSKSAEEAYHLYSRGAAAGSVEALFNQGRAQVYGIGTKTDISAGVAKLREAAEKNEQAAKVLLASFYAEGKFVKRDVEESNRLYREAAEQGNPRAQYVLAGTLRSDTDKEKMEQAVALYKKAAEQGDADAQFALARCYAEERWHTPDLVSAVQWCRAAADQGHPAALCAMGLFRLDSAQTDEAVRAAIPLLTKSAEAGYMPAEFVLGQIYEQGRLGERDPRSAVQHYRTAAEGGNAPAQVRLAAAYSRGELGLSVNLNEAFRLYLSAARLGDDVAQCNVAALYASGTGVTKSNRQSFFWYKSAADQGNIQAEYNVGLMMLRGIGTWKNSSEGLRWLEHSAATGYAPAQTELGTLYSAGKDVRRNFETAKRWLQSAADEGYAPAQFNLGLLYTYSSSDEGGDPAAAISYFEQAAAQGHTRSAWYLGSAYEEGRGVEQDYAKAAEYYRVASEAGNKRASESLKRVESKEKEQHEKDRLEELREGEEERNNE